MNTPSLPLTLPDGQPLPPPPGQEWREHTAGRFRDQDRDGYEFAVYLVRELGITNKCKLEDMVSTHRKARGLPGISRNTIIALMNDPSEFLPGQIDDIIRRRSSLTTADALDKVEELLNAAKAAKDLGAAAMALTAVYNVKQLSSGGATRISGNTQDHDKAKGFDHFMQRARQELEKRQQAPELPVETGTVVEMEMVAVNDKHSNQGSEI